MPFGMLLERVSCRMPLRMAGEGPETSHEMRRKTVVLGVAFVPIAFGLSSAVKILKRLFEQNAI